MSDEPEDKRAIRERLQELMELISNFESPEDVPPELWSELIDLLAKRANITVEEIKIELEELPGPDWFAFVLHLKERQGTKTVDFNALYEYRQALDRKLMGGD